jgi:hypothetical protein
MKNIIKSILFFSFLIVLPSIGVACDACSFFNYYQIQNKHFLSLSYRYRVLNGYNVLGQSPIFSAPARGRKHTSVGNSAIFAQNKADYETFETLELRYNHHFDGKYNVQAYLPYRKSTDYYAEVYPTNAPVKDSLNTNQGIGDLGLYAERIFLDKNNFRTHYFTAGLGLSLPTGNSTIRETEGDPAQDPSHLPGKGTAEGLVRGQYIFTYHGKIGLQAVVQYDRSFRSKEGKTISVTGNLGKETLSYRFGDRFSSNLMGFYILQVKGPFSVIPRAGAYLETQATDEISGIELDDTGGTILSSSFGIDLNYTRYTLQLMGQAPMWQSLNGEQLLQAGTAQARVMVNF